MDNALTVGDLRVGLGRVATALEARAPDLNAADARLGDGDLGVTVQRGARELRDQLDAPTEDLGTALMGCARAFTRVSGSSYGTLLATGLMAAARVCRGRRSLPWGEFPGLLEAARDAMMARGRSVLGQKTVLDALEAARAAMVGARDPDALLAAARAGVAESMEAFRDRPAQQGRARMFGERSVGLDDPGMLAFQVMVESLAEQIGSASDPPGR